jgi:hypothetical protein
VPSSICDPVRTIVAPTLDDRSRIQEPIGLLLPPTFGRETLVFEVFDPDPYGHDGWVVSVRRPVLRSISPRCGAARRAVARFPVRSRSGVPS